MPLIQRRHSCIYFGKPLFTPPFLPSHLSTSHPLTLLSSFPTNPPACLDERLRRGTSANRVWFGTADYWHTVYWNISSFSSPLNLDEVDISKDEGRCGSHVSKQGAFSPGHWDHPFPPPADLEIKPRGGRRTCFTFCHLHNSVHFS